jgi:hypothetical protein
MNIRMNIRYIIISVYEPNISNIECPLVHTRMHWLLVAGFNPEKNIGDHHPTMWGPRSIAKLVYSSNNYGLWYL